MINPEEEAHFNEVLVEHVYSHTVELFNPDEVNLAVGTGLCFSGNIQ